MALSADQQAQLDALLAEQSKPPYRTSSGLGGVLHELVDLVTGVIAHVSPERAAALHDEVEAAAGDGGGDQAAADEGQDSPSSASSPSE